MRRELQPENWNCPTQLLAFRLIDQDHLPRTAPNQMRIEKGEERILGSAAFVEKVRGTLQTTDPLPGRRHSLAALVAVVCAATGCYPTALPQGSRRGRAARAHEGLAYLALEVCGYTGSAAADLLGVRPSAVHRTAQCGRTARGRWERVLTVGETEKNIRMSLKFRLPRVMDRKVECSP